VGNQNIEAVLFDMDGTIIDSEPHWLRAEQELVEKFGGTWSEEQGLALVGSGLWNSASLLQNAGVDMDVDDIVLHLSNRVLHLVNESIPWLPGVRELIAELMQQGIPCALVTMSLRKNAEALAHAISQEIGQEVFSVIVGGDDVEYPKPNPEAYLSAAHQLGVDVTRCVAFEDSSFGAASAFSAGAVTIGVPLAVQIPHHSVHVLWDSMRGKTLADLTELWNLHRSQDGA
jgi:HAD superfamily hydrolase (TIGR01509 family)